MTRRSTLAAILAAALVLGAVATAQAQDELTTTVAFLSATRDGIPVRSTLLLLCPDNPARPPLTATDLDGRITALQGSLTRTMPISNLALVTYRQIALKVGEEQAVLSPNDTLPCVPASHNGHSVN
jgi:hypothetical protein